MPSDTVVLALSRNVDQVTKSSVEALTAYAVPSDFEFTYGGVVALPRYEEGRVVSWDLIEAFLIAERERRGCARVIGVLEDPIEQNWFSRTAYGRNVAWITVDNWEFYSDLPLESYVGYQLVTNLILMHLVRRPEEEGWLMRQVVHVTETRGCIHDMCAFKPDLARGIRSGNICPDCRDTLRGRLGGMAVDTALRLLAIIKGLAVPQEQKTSIRDFPQLRQLQQEIQERGSKISPASEMKRPRRRSHDDFDAAGAPMMMSFSLSRDLLSEEGSEEPDNSESETRRFETNIERVYPFPVAYCFRSVRAQIEPERKWAALYDLYRLIIRYTAFLLVAGCQEQKRALPRSTSELLTKATAAGDGTWGRGTFDLLRAEKQVSSQAQGALATFLESFHAEQLEELIIASKQIVQQRNETQGHGYQVDTIVYQKAFESHLPGVKAFLQFMEPLSKYALISPAKIERNYGGECLFVAQLLMGSHPLFETLKIRDRTAPETVCQTTVPGRKERLLLHPWIQLDRCNECAREMVFLFDRVDPRSPGKGFMLREYPSNHTMQGKWT